MPPEEIERRIALIASDHHSGSREIAMEAASVALLLEQENPSPALWEYFAIQILRAHTDMASLWSLIICIFNALTENNHPGKAIQSFLDTIESSTQKMGHSLTDLIEDTHVILTHSYSSSVLEALKIASSHRQFRVIVTESSPGKEGRRMATKLGDAGIEVTFICDAAVHWISGECTHIIVGADWVGEDAFINKIGTWSLAQAALSGQADCLVLADTSKFVTSAHFKLAQKVHDSSEVWSIDHPKILIKNPYFESIPNELVTGFVTEEGIITLHEVSDYLQTIPSFLSDQMSQFSQCSELLSSSTQSYQRKGGHT